MTPIRLSKLLEGIDQVSANDDLIIKSLALDSRQVQPESLFFACQGTHSDGRLFIKEAIKKGAVAILAEKNSSKPIETDAPIFWIQNLNDKISDIASRFYGNPGQSLNIVGITGTNGKTSSSHFIAAILQSLGQSCGVIGTLGSGLYGNIKEGTLTTPDAISVQKTLADFVAEKARYAVMEVSSHSLDQGRVRDVPFKIGVFTNLTRDHLDYHGTMEAYGAAKAKLFEYPSLSYAVINIDDPFGLELAKKTPAKVYAYSSIKQPKKHDFPIIQAHDIHLSPAGIEAHLSTPWGQGTLNSKLIGDFNISNLLATLTSLCLLDIPFEDVLQSIASLKSVPGRMQSFGGRNKPLVVVDYSHTPDSLEKALAALRAHCQGKLYCVFGCGGDRDRGKRPLMASIAEKMADSVIVTDDNPRTEDPKKITDDILKGFSKTYQATVQHDRSKAIRNAIQYAKPGDCVLIAGKGAETYQQIGEEKIPFSDIDQVKFYL